MTVFGLKSSLTRDAVAPGFLERLLQRLRPARGAAGFTRQLLQLASPRQDTGRLSSDKFWSCGVSYPTGGGLPPPCPRSGECVCARACRGVWTGASRWPGEAAATGLGPARMRGCVFGCARVRPGHAARSAAATQRGVRVRGRAAVVVLTLVPGGAARRLADAPGRDDALCP